MKLRCRNRPSATVLHFNVLMTLGSALPLAISSSRPALSMGARQPVRTVCATRFSTGTVSATAWLMSFLSCSWFRYRPFCSMQEPCHSCAVQKAERNHIFERKGKAGGAYLRSKGGQPLPDFCPHRVGTEKKQNGRSTP